MNQHPQQPNYQQPTAPKSSSKKLLIVLGVIFGSCGLCGLLGSIANLVNPKNEISSQITSNSLQAIPISSPIVEANLESDIQTLDKGVVLNFKVETNGTRQPKIVGKTNLPDGTELLISIDSKTVKYNASSKVVVQNGRFESTTFTNNQNDLEVGQYTTQVIMPIARVQTPEIRAIIGQNGKI